MVRVSAEVVRFRDCVRVVALPKTNHPRKARPLRRPAGARNVIQDRVFKPFRRIRADQAVAVEDQFLATLRTGQNAFDFFEVEGHEALSEC